jgi:hypothetical protein
MAGTFAPIISHVAEGNISYMSNNFAEGIVMLILAAVSLVAVLTKRYRVLWVTGPASVAMIIITIVRHQLEWLAELSYFKNDPTNNMRSADLIPSSQITWGAVVLFVGAILVLMAAAKCDPLRPRKRQGPAQSPVSETPSSETSPPEPEAK